MYEEVKILETVSPHLALLYAKKVSNEYYLTLQFDYPMINFGPLLREEPH